MHTKMLTTEGHFQILFLNVKKSLLLHKVLNLVPFGKPLHLTYNAETKECWTGATMKEGNDIN